MKENLTFNFKDPIDQSDGFAVVYDDGIRLGSLNLADFIPFYEISNIIKKNNFLLITLSNSEEKNIEFDPNQNSYRGTLDNIFDYVKLKLKYLSLVDNHTYLTTLSDSRTSSIEHFYNFEFHTDKICVYYSMEKFKDYSYSEVYNIKYVDNMPIITLQNDVRLIGSYGTTKFLYDLWKETT